MAKPTPINTAKFAQQRTTPALKSYIRSIVLHGYQVGVEKLQGQPDKLKLLNQAREELEDKLGL